MADRRDPSRQLIELADYRARTAELYARVRAIHADDPARAWRTWAADRAELLDTHPQSPTGSEQLAYWGYDPAWSFRLELEPSAIIVPIELLEADDRPPRRFERVATVSIPVPEGPSIALPIYWSDSYGGGFLVPFRDSTNGNETFGSGRYVLDGAKGADLGRHGTQIVIDFNFAYHPSCVWGAWVCPLPSPASRLDVPVRAGERKPPLD